MNSRIGDYMLDEPEDIDEEWIALSEKTDWEYEQALARLDTREYFANLPGGEADYMYDPMRGKG